MAIMGQGLVLMIAGMGIVYAFLIVLVWVSKFSMKGIARFNYLFPEPAPKKAPARVAAASDDAALAVAIAVARAR